MIGPTKDLRSPDGRMEGAMPPFNQGSPILGSRPVKVELNCGPDFALGGVLQS